jgi:hypothetical protein
VQAFLNFSFGAVPVAIRIAHKQLTRAAGRGQRARLTTRARMLQVAASPESKPSPASTIFYMTRFRFIRI